MQYNEYAAILQTSVSPVILISGVGLWILSMTNRFGRVVDRARQLKDMYRVANDEDRKRQGLQLEILIKRAKLLRLAISSGTLSALLAAALVISLFFSAFLHLEGFIVTGFLFIACLVSFIISLLVFLQDINLSLSALRVELG